MGRPRDPSTHLELGQSTPQADHGPAISQLMLGKLGWCWWVPSRGEEHLGPKLNLCTFYGEGMPLIVYQS